MPQPSIYERATLEAVPGDAKLMIGAIMELGYRIPDDLSSFELRTQNGDLMPVVVIAQDGEGRDPHKQVNNSVFYAEDYDGLSVLVQTDCGKLLVRENHATKLVTVEKPEGVQTGMIDFIRDSDTNHLIYKDNGITVGMRGIVVVFLESCKSPTDIYLSISAVRIANEPPRESIVHPM